MRGEAYPDALVHLASRAEAGTAIRTNVTHRLDALEWSRWHRRVVFALGVTWILDGLEASLIANLGARLQDPRALGLSAGDVGLANSVYLAGQVAGALVFGHLADRFGRKKLFLVTLSVYLIATALSGLAPGFGSFLVLRFIAGSGIGGEYSAINAAIDELIPARVRGQIDLAINGSYWIGVALGAVLSAVLLNPAIVPVAIGWRLVFGLGAIIGVAVILVRREVPESPRWLLMHGYVHEAETTMAAIERSVYGAPKEHGPEMPQTDIRVTGVVGFGAIARTLLHKHRKRTILGLALMTAQAFFYNAIFFTYGLILHRYYGVADEKVGLYMIPFAAGNFLGPLLLGRLFDVVGRKRMIFLTYALSGVLLAITGQLFKSGLLGAGTQTAAWCVVFFFASSAASSAYLTVSELFPVEMRGMAIALFYATATALGGVVAPSVFGIIVESGSRPALFEGYVFASVLMIAASIVAIFLAVNAEGKSLEALSDGH